MDNVGIVQDQGVCTGSCGYCGGSDCSASHGMWAHRLTAADYNDLLDRGWRRSGHWLYKPQLAETCCKQYTIRLDTRQFQRNKRQHKVVRKLAAWLAGRSGKPDVTDGSKAPEQSEAGAMETAEESHESGEASSSKRAAPLEMQRDEIQTACLEALPPEVREHLGSTKLRLEAVPRRKAAKLPEGVAFTSPSCFAAAAAARKAGMSHVTPAGLATTIASNLTDAVEAEGSSRLATLGLLWVEAAGGHLNFHIRPEARPSPSTSASPLQQQEALGRKERALMGKRPKSKAGPLATDDRPAATAAPNSTREVEHQDTGGGNLALKFLGLTSYTGSSFTVEMLPARFDIEEFALYRKYQLIHHGDTPSDLTESRYKGFLVDTPILRVPWQLGSALPPCGLGTFHIQYRVDGHLVAVSVVDVLPRCVSSKYFFWDPDYAALSLGKISALYEIFMVQDWPMGSGLDFYYLGYYIHDCSKMRYKADYHPSNLLCPVEYVWVPYSLASKMLDESDGDLCVFSKALAAEKELADLGVPPEGCELEISKVGMTSRNRCPAFTDEQVLNTTVLASTGLTSLKDEISKSGGARPELLAEIREWCNAVGLPAKRLVYVLSRMW